jgi:undecaprenyl-diphosphatase
MRKIKSTLTVLFFCIACLGAKAQSIDIRLLEHFNGPPSSADGLWHGISNSDYIFVFGTPATMLVTGLATHDRELKIKALETGGAIFLAEGSTFVLKNVFHRERPYIAHPDLFYGKSSATDYSFPSGHTSTAFATATALSLSFPKWYVIAPSFAYASAVGYSRMYLGVHYPTDVVGGAVLGAGSAFLTFKLNNWLHKKIH